ncbi:MAG: glycosyltransferase [Lachnospiraceae bacterium]|nr:glycosyltransferase [Lachnospiraceae bacterium]
MTTAAIIVNYNDGKTLYEKVKSISASTVIDAVIVVDNKSTDDSLTAIQELDKVIILYGERNGGYGYGNNIGLRYAREVLHADYAVISNPDTEITDKCLNAMIAMLSSDDRIAACAPMCDTPGSRFEAPACAWPFRTWRIELFEHCPILRKTVRKAAHYPAAAFTDKDHAEVFAVLGSCLSVNIDKVLETGAYDEDIFLYCEENVLGYKLKEHGYKTMLLCKESYFHNHKPSIPDPKNVRILRDSELIYFSRYLKTGAFKMLISRILFAIVSLETRLFC